MDARVSQGFRAWPSGGVCHVQPGGAGAHNDPCAHCIVSAPLGAGPAPKLSSSSSTAGGAVRTWSTVGDFTQEVAVARIYDGVHYRNSTEVGTAMGQKVGELAVKSFPKSTRWEELRRHSGVTAHF